MLALSADAVVVGAGVMGASIALELARSGRRVVVVDKAGGIGHGSTSASSAVVRFNYSTWAGVATSWEARSHWVHWREHLGVPAGTDGLARLVPCGLALLDVDVLPRDRFLPSFDRAGVPYEEWDAAGLARRVPGLDPGRHWPPRRLSDERFWAEPEASLGAVFTPDAGYVTDPQLAAANLADAARRLGAEFRLRRTVTAIDRTGDRVRAVRLDDGSVIATPVVVNAAGPWSTRVNELAGVGGDFAVGLRPLRQEVHRVAAPPGWNGIALADVDLGVYLRGDSGGGLLVGGTEPECDPLHWVDDPDAVDHRVTGAVFEAQVTRAARRLTGLSVPNRPSGVVGVYDVADDWTPVYDRTDLPGFFVAIGTSGNQFKNAPLVGAFLRALVDHAEDGKDHDTDPVHLRGPYTGAEIDLSAFSRLRPGGAGNSGTVMG
ncbi:NAD(P)/FAD-dependent oxidoreductase [Kitasatospora sp. NBC_01539]|uniref:NAD(P)/FAD-dependent oxidoreductase n=1 Tax=Kitasatospora sp. NBC_01539 TaxID=2903577 RepID=UPI0038600F5B